jgi:hypothetical protein
VHPSTLTMHASAHDQHVFVTPGRGISIALALLALLIGAACGAPERVRPPVLPVLPVLEDGHIAGAAFRIQLPEQWNGDLVLYAQMHAYTVLTGLAGTGRLFAAQFAEARGHCAITPAQTVAALDALAGWVRDARRPVAIEAGPR